MSRTSSCFHMETSRYADYRVAYLIGIICFNLYCISDPNSCGSRVNIGEAIEGMANQAFVLLTREPFTATRTLIINALGLGLSVLWLITSVGLMSTWEFNFIIVFHIGIAFFV